MPLITDPHQPNFWADYSVNPGENTNPPPAGAPEGWLANQVNDVLRQMMAGLRQLGNFVVALNNALGTMAGQNANAVNITGGTVNSSTLTGIITSIRLQGFYHLMTAGNSEKVGGVSLQHLYDFIHPVGTIMVKRNDTPLTIPPGVVAGWTKTGGGRVLRGVEVGAGVEGGSPTSVTSVAGSHVHGVGGLSTSGPSTTRQANLGSGSTNTAGHDHTHTLSGATDANGAHNHTVAIDPPFVTVIFWLRVF